MGEPWISRKARWRVAVAATVGQAALLAGYFVASNDAAIILLLGCVVLAALSGIFAGAIRSLAVMGTAWVAWILTTGFTAEPHCRYYWEGGPDSGPFVGSDGRSCSYVEVTTWDEAEWIARGAAVVLLAILVGAALALLAHGTVRGFSLLRHTRAPLQPEPTNAAERDVD